jgi:hypothetical protein
MTPPRIRKVDPDSWVRRCPVLPCGSLFGAAAVAGLLSPRDDTERHSEVCRLDSQPSAEVAAIAEAARADLFRGYGCDGDDHLRVDPMYGAERARIAA